MGQWDIHLCCPAFVPLAQTNELPKMHGIARDLPVVVWSLSFPQVCETQPGAVWTGAEGEKVHQKQMP